MDKRIIGKKSSGTDHRIYYLNLTAKGRKLSERLSRWADHLKNGLANIAPANKENMFSAMMEIIKAMQLNGVIEKARMCISCDNFIKDAHPGTKRPHECGLTHTPLSVSQLKIDCTTYSQIEAT